MMNIDCGILFQYTYLASFVILYYDQPMHNNFTNYHTATCFDTRVILRELVINTLPSYTSKPVKHLNCKLYYQQLHLKYWCNWARYWLQAVWGWHDSVETCSSVILCEIIVYLLVTVQNTKLIAVFRWISRLRFSGTTVTATYLLTYLLTCFKELLFKSLYRPSLIILYCDQQMHKYFTNYHTATCFDTIVSPSGSL